MEIDRLATFIGLLEPYVGYLVIVLIGLLISYIKTYLSSHAKSKAINSLSREKEQIATEFKKEMAEISKKHQLDIQKRKYQYESKREAYINFLNFLDQYNAHAGKQMVEKFFPIIKEFFTKNLKAKINKKHELALISRFHSQSLDIMNEGYEHYTRLKQETNSIKLSASEEVLNHLSKLEMATEKMLDEATSRLKDIPIIIESGDEDAIKEIVSLIESYGSIVMLHKDAIIEYMRLDLKEI